jgi:hypothetical protein
MTLFVLLISVPAFLFCCVALVHFQQEIRESDAIGLARGKSAVAKKILLDGQDYAALESRSDTEGSGKRLQPEVYQLESAYLGPFFVVRAGNGRDWGFSNAPNEHHRIASAARG